MVLYRSANSDVHSTPGGWTALVLNATADGSSNSTSIFYKAAAGGETTVTVNGTQVVKFACLAWRITGHEVPGTQAPEISTIATGNSTTPDPTTVTPTGGSKDYLFLWAGGWEGEQNTGVSPPAASPPTGYGNAAGGASGTAGSITTNTQVAGASRQLTAASEDPGSWTISAADDWSAWTIAIHPAGGGGGGPTCPKTLALLGVGC